LKTGDHIVINRVGAYNMTQWMQFITLRPKVVMISEEGQVNVIRKGEDMSSINDYEVLPSHLEKFDL
jgi:diaminopimelate decarboxylase